MDIFLNQLIRFCLNNDRNLHHLASHTISCCRQDRGRNVTTDYHDTSALSNIQKKFIVVALLLYSCNICCLIDLLNVLR